MRRFITVICLLWCLSLCVAEPGRNSRLRAERKKKERQEREEARRQQLLNSGWKHREEPSTERLSLVEYWKNKTDDAADRAYLMYSLTRLNLVTLQQSYLFMIDEVKGPYIRRKSACRDTIGRNGRQKGYFKCFDIGTWKFPDREESTEDEEIELAHSLMKSLSFEDVDDGTIYEPETVTMNAKFFLRHWRNLDLTFRFEEGESDPVKLRSKDWTCEVDNTFDNLYCEWNAKDKTAQIEPYYWNP